MQINERYNSIYIVGDGVLDAPLQFARGMSGTPSPTTVNFNKLTNFCLAAEYLRRQTGVISLNIFNEVLEQAVRYKFLFSGLTGCRTEQPPLLKGIPYQGNVTK